MIKLHGLHSLPKTVNNHFQLVSPRFYHSYFVLMIQFRAKKNPCMYECITTRTPLLKKFAKRFDIWTELSLLSNQTWFPLMTSSSFSLILLLLIDSKSYTNNIFTTSFCTIKQLHTWTEFWPTFSCWSVDHGGSKNRFCSCSILFYMCLNWRD